MYKFMFFLCLLVSFTGNAEKFNVVVGFAKPPYVIQENNSGFELELVGHVIKAMGKSPYFVFVPFGRSPNMLERNDVDSIMTINANMITDTSYLSDVYIIYQNVAISLKKNHKVINDIEGLSKVSVAAFQMATTILGSHYASAVADSPFYIEVANQKRQTKLLFEDKVESVVMDVNIFNALSPLVGGESDHSDVDVHYIFPKSPYHMAFKDKANIAKFNKALQEFKSSQAYSDLIDKYNLKGNIN